MKKRLTILLILITIFGCLVSSKNIKAYEYVGNNNFDKVPVIHSVEMDKGNWHYDYYDPAPEQIYPGTYLRVEGEDFIAWFRDEIAKRIEKRDSAHFYLDGVYIALSFSKQFVGLIQFWLPSDSEPGRHYVEVESTLRGFKSDKFYFEVLSRACEENDWQCDDWDICNVNSMQTRTCNKISDCEDGISSPATSQSCIYTPPCTADTWQCDNWETCSPQGIQTRSCNKTFDCSSAQTASPSISQYCVPSGQQYETPSDNLGITNQDSIIKATVKLLCPLSRTMASQGSGTIIDSSGTILTNKHVVDGTSGCLIGFIDDYDDEPYFGDRQIADIYSVSTYEDMAILKLRNPYNRSLTSVNITQGNANNLSLGDTMTTYGYPAMFGTNITYTSGDFSGVDGNYLKTTAIIEHGNSGGGAYLKNGTYLGIPSAVVKGSLNSMGYVLSINKINSWLNNSPTAYNYNNNNNYSRVSSILEDIDLNTLGSLGLYITGDDITIEDEPTNDSNENNDNIDTNLSNRLKGKLLLQVNQGGRIWYVNPDDSKRFEVTFANALPLFENFALGITNSDLDDIPEHSDSWTSAVGNRLKGKLLLQVEDRGRIWYVDFDGKRWEVTWANLMELFESLALGITDEDLNKIGSGSLGN